MTKGEQARLVAWRLRVLQATLGRRGNVAPDVPLLRGYPGRRSTSGRSATRRTGRPGCAIAPRTPHRSPRATPPEVVSKILYLRQQYHFGAGRIADYLSGFTSSSIAGSYRASPPESTGMNRLPANQKHRPHGKRWKRYEKPQPGHRLQMDVKFLERIPGTRKRLYQFTAIDDCTRIRVLKVYDACNQRTAIQFVDEVIRRLPFRVHVIQTDNGAEFQSSSTGTWRRWTSGTCTSGPGRRISTARSNARTGSTTRSSISCWIGTASPTTSTCSTRSCASLRTA